MARDPDIILSLPCTGYITQHFGENPQNYAKFGQPGHAGIDIGVPEGTKLGAMAKGVVEKVGDDPKGYGKYVKIWHQSTRGRYHTILAHMSNIAVFTGQMVEAGQTVGYSGNTGNSTGPHVHCELQIMWDTYPGYKYQVANIEQYISNTVPSPIGNVPGVPNPGPAPVNPGAGAQLKPGTAMINENMTNIRLTPSLGSVPLAFANAGTIFDYTGEYCEAEGRKWRILHVYVADELVDERRPLTEAEKRLVPGPR